MWSDQLIPHIDTQTSYRQHDILDLFKANKIKIRRLPVAFLKTVGWNHADHPLSGHQLLQALRAYRPVRGRKSTPELDRRSIRLPIRVSTRELDFLKLISKLYHLSINNFILMLVLEKCLPTPDEGMSIEVVQFLEDILSSVNTIEEAMRNGKVDPVSLCIFNEINTKVSVIKTELITMHQFSFAFRNLMEPKSKRITLVLSHNEMELFDKIYRLESPTKAIRRTVFKDRVWNHCKTVSPKTYDQIKDICFDVGLLALGIRSGEEPAVKPVLTQTINLLQIAMLDLQVYDKIGNASE